MLRKGLEFKRRLIVRRLLARSRNRHDEARWPASAPRLAFERLAVVVERMVQFRRPVWRVQNRPIVKAGQLLRPPRNSLCSSFIAMRPGSRREGLRKILQVEAGRCDPLALCFAPPCSLAQAGQRSHGAKGAFSLLQKGGVPTGSAAWLFSGRRDQLLRAMPRASM